MSFTGSLLIPIQIPERKKFRYEEKLEKEIDGYEHHTVTWVDRYYHLVELEETSPLNLPQVRI